MSLSASTLEFLEGYPYRWLPKNIVAANEAEKCVAEALKDLPVAIHLVTGPAKKTSSLRRKTRIKRYRDPQKEITEFIGVRVITFFANDIDSVSEGLCARLEVSARKSRDVRLELEENEFGYRSNHLIARLKAEDAHGGRFPKLGRRWFEIQVRSILDHAWSEIEHEVVYKSGILFPKDVRR